jgi:predicted DNA-binding protein
MGIVTVRLNEEEEIILEILQKHFEEDKSKILKKAMWDKFEDLRDKEVIEDYEKNLKIGKVKFESADDLIRQIKQKNKARG